MEFYIENLLAQLKILNSINNYLSSIYELSGNNFPNHNHV